MRSELKEMSDDESWVWNPYERRWEPRCKHGGLERDCPECQAREERIARFIAKRLCEVVPEFVQAANNVARDIGRTLAAIAQGGTDTGLATTTSCGEETRTSLRSDSQRAGDETPETRKSAPSVGANLNTRSGSVMYAQCAMARLCGEYERFPRLYDETCPWYDKPSPKYDKTGLSAYVDHTK